MINQNPYLPIEAKIEKIIDETSNIKTFVIKPKEPVPFKTGQFVSITVPGVGEAPFTPSSSPLIKERFDVTIMNVGSVTKVLHGLRGGETIGVRGPFGAGYPVEKFYDREVLIVGGGVGMAPLRSLLLTLISQIHKFKKVVLCYGTKTPEDVVYKPLFEEWRKIKGLEILRSVDKCPSGYKWDETTGVVTCLLDKCNVHVSNSVAVVCGPPIMMKFATLKLVDMKFRPADIYLSMERNMSCGVGKCGHCAIGPHFPCKDGPVFTYEKVKSEPEVWA